MRMMKKMNKDILLIKTNTLLPKETLKQLHDDFVEQIKSRVVIIPAYFDCEMLNVQDDVEVIIRPKDEEQVLF